MLVALAPLPALAATVTRNGDTLKITGTITPGDGARVRAAMTQDVRVAVLTSTGGDTGAGLEIGKFLRPYGLTMVVDRYCMSSCANYIFAAGKQRIVRRNSVVCYHGGSPRTREELQSYMRYMIANARGTPPVTLAEIDLIVDSESDRFGQNVRDELQLMKSMGIDDRILPDSKFRMVPRRLLLQSHQPLSPFLREAEIAWCPSAEQLARYGIATDSMWYPANEDELYKLGTRISRNFILVSRVAAEVPSDQAGRYIAAPDFSGGLELVSDLSDLYNNMGVIDEAQARGDKAFADYAVAIRLKPESPWPYNNRGVANVRRGRFQEAMADFDTAQRLHPDYPAVRRNRAAALVAMGRYDDAVREFDEAIKLAPDYSAALTERGRANFDAGRFDAAIADFTASLKANPLQPYAVLWLHLARIRAEDDDTAELASNAAKLKPASWPAPVVAFYRGQMSADDLMRQAAHSTPKTDRDQRCEASFYVGQAELGRRNFSQAGKLLQAAQESCPVDFVEYHGAVAELRRFRQ